MRITSSDHRGLYLETPRAAPPSSTGRARRKVRRSCSSIRPRRASVEAVDIPARCNCLISPRCLWTCVRIRSISPRICSMSGMVPTRENQVAYENEMRTKCKPLGLAVRAC
jgi:hypothetical protein